MAGTKTVNIVAEYLLYNHTNMEPDFLHIEKELAIEAWIMYAFKIYDMLLQEDFEFDGWLKADENWYQPN